MTGKLLTLREACKWASSHLRRNVTESNISYLIQYGKIRRYDARGNPKKSSNGVTMISLPELRQYYDNSRKRIVDWEERLGKDINWHLSFDNIRETERTKHVHRLHPYKGKFIPQLVEYFLDTHTDHFKENVFFYEKDVILDPFAGSGTTLVQCQELGLHSIGIDISKFNCMISQAKVSKYDLERLSEELRKAAKATREFSEAKFRYEPQSKIDELLSSFNKQYYPNPEFKIMLGSMREYQSKIESEIITLTKGDDRNRQEIAENVLNRHKDELAILEREIASLLRRNSVPIRFSANPENVGNLANEFAGEYARTALEQLDKELRNILARKQTELATTTDEEAFHDSRFLSTWFTKRQRLEMQFYLDQIDGQDDPKIGNVMRIILSRTARSCRATKHVDLATLIRPQSRPYYCRKHFKICRPISTVIRHLTRYTEDTIKRLREFSKLRKSVFCEVLNDDSRTVNILDRIREKNEAFYRILDKRKIDGIFTSPPYVGQIDYHEQHAYSYELFDVTRKDDLEIGRKSSGVGRKAQSAYIEGISAVLRNAKDYLKEGAHVFIVANDRKNLYPKIAEASGLERVKVFRRPVLNRTERDKQPYSESVFHYVN